jgi:phosphatidate cytidylyltransferase
MSPSRALESPVFLFYSCLGASLLVFGGLVLAVLKWRLKKDIGQASAAYRGWLLMVPLLLVVYFLGREVAILFATFLALLAFREFAGNTGLDRDGLLTNVVYLAILALGVVCLIPDPRSGNPGWYGLFLTMPVFVVAVILAIPVVRNRAQGQLQPLCLAVVGFVYFGWMFGHLAFLANSAYAYNYLGYLVLAVELNDVAAYIFGKLFGRHPLRTNISPKKTWEGAVGALAISLLLPWALYFTFPQFVAMDYIVAGVIVGVGGQMGDLIVSVIKRDLGIKDMGRVIAGHGGILDRTDSLIYVTPLFFHYLRCRHVFGPSS